MCKFESCVLEGLVASVDVMDGVLYSRWLYKVGNTLAKVSQHGWWASFVGQGYITLLCFDSVWPTNIRKKYCNTKILKP